MTRDYRPRQMPARFLTNAPPAVMQQVADIIDTGTTHCPFEILLKENDGHGNAVGIDFSEYGARGQHFFLTPTECRSYRKRQQRNRTAWERLPTATQRAVMAYLSA